MFQGPEQFNFKKDNLPEEAPIPDELEFKPLEPSQEEELNKIVHEVKDKDK